MNTALLVLLVFIYAVAMVLLLLTALQGMRLRHLSDQKSQRDKLSEEAYPSPSSVGLSARKGNTVRAYAISCDFSASRTSTYAKRPSFKTDQLTFCEGQHMGTKTFYFSNPYWLIVDVTRSSRLMYDDILNGISQHVLFNGHPCRIRTASKSERKSVEPTSQKIRTKNGMLFVIADERDFPSSSCTPPRAFALSGNTDPEQWTSMMSERAVHETEGKSTLMHVWGYSVSS